MCLREIKKEVESLHNVEHSLERLEENWLKASSPFLKDLDNDEKKELQQKLTALDQQFAEVKQGQQINEKLRHYARYLIELKLTTFNGDENKSILITDQLLYDDFLNFKQTINEFHSFKGQLKEFSNSYQKINQWLEQRFDFRKQFIV